MGRKKRTTKVEIAVGYTDNTWGLCTVDLPLCTDVELLKNQLFTEAKEELQKVFARRGVVVAFMANYSILPDEEE
jgi:hypothetical protein